MRNPHCYTSFHKQALRLLTGVKARQAAVKARQAAVKTRQAAARE